MLFFSLLLIFSFFIAKHFIDQGIKTPENSQNITGESLTVPAPEKEPQSSTLLPPAQKMTDTKAVKQTAATAPSFKALNSEPLPEKSVNFSFYTGLAKSEVRVDVEPISVKLDGRYFIQAGSFKHKERALKEQARIKKHGIQLKVSSLKSPTRTTYRLITGPFEDRLIMNKKRNQLRRLGVDTQLFKVAKKP